MKQRLMVVDDEPQVRELLSLYLEQRGFEVCSAASTAETLEVLDRKPVDLVVLDIGLAEEDGLKLLSALKTRYKNVKVVMLTGMGFVEDLLQEAQQKGADGYVSKTLPLDELMQTITHLLKTEGMQGTMQARL